MIKYWLTASVVALLCFPYSSTKLVAGPIEDSQVIPLTEEGQQLELAFTRQLEHLREKLLAKIPAVDQLGGERLNRLITDESLDDDLVRFVVLKEATPAGLARFAQVGEQQKQLLKTLLANPPLMKEMLIADGAKAVKHRHGYGPAQYGRCMEIYDAINRSSSRASSGVFHRLSLAISLEHAVPVIQTNPVEDTVSAGFVDPVARFQHYQKAFLDGELDRAFDRLTTWDLRMVVDGDEPDDTLAWGRQMLRNFRPDHVLDPSDGWRYVSIVGSNVRYGSDCVKFDRPELQKYQNILMNGGVCGRRAFFGRFILRSFGVPTIARPSRGHGALAHWTPDGWVVNLGGGWGAGWTNTLYSDDVDFLKNTQARRNPEAFAAVKRAHWIGDLFDESRIYSHKDGDPGFWNATALRRQQEIIDRGDSVTLDALGEELAEADKPLTPSDTNDAGVQLDPKQIQVSGNGSISIPAASFLESSRGAKEVAAMRSFSDGMQVFLPRFFPKGLTVMRGGTWKGEPDACTSGKRMLSGGYGRYENWGLRAAVSVASDNPPRDLTLEVAEGVTMDFVLIPAGSFVMGGTSSKDGRFECVELPKHEVELTKGFYLGKYEVTQKQYEAVMNANPSRSTKDPQCPVDNVSESDALSFCGKMAEAVGMDVRLPTEAEWEYASRAGASSTWFFGEDPSGISDYAWFKGNADAKSHPVGLKKPNPWGLFDIYGNVCERISDKYQRDYYATSPRQDPTGPSPGTHSHLDYQITVPKSGRYELTVGVVTVNYGQRINFSVNQDDAKVVVDLPFSNGDWATSEPVTLMLTEGENTLRLWRDYPPQYGIAINEIQLEFSP